MDLRERSKITALLSTPEGLQWRRVHYGKARLESTRRSSIILAAFSFSVFSSLQLNYPSNCPPWLITLLAVNSAVLVSMHSFSFTISTFLLPKLQAVSEEYKRPREGDFIMKQVPQFSPHEKFRGFVEFSYTFSHILGLFLFLLEIVFIAWVKFWDVSFNACVASTVIMIPFMIIFATFCWYFNRILNNHVYETRTHLLQDVEREFSRSEQTVYNSSIWALGSPQGDISMTPQGSLQSSEMMYKSAPPYEGHINKFYVQDEDTTARATLNLA